MKTTFLAIIMLAACVVMLGVKVLFVKGGKFPSGHNSAHLRKRGVGCAVHQSETSK